MKGYSIGAVAQRTGLSPHLIRVWERRYDAVEPERDQGGRRYYTDAQIQRLFLLSRLVNMGQPIGRIANLSNEDLQQQIETMRSPLPAATSHNPAYNALPSPRDVLLNAVLDSAKCYDIESCTNAIAAALIGVGVDDLMNDICSPIMRAIGEEWSAGRLNEAQEHIIGTAFKGFLLPRITSSLIRKKAPAMVFSTFQDERHEFGLLFFATMAAARNIRCFYLGPDLPDPAIADAVIHVDAKVLALSVVNNTSRKDVLRHLLELRNQLPPDRQIWLGGQALEDSANADLPQNCFILGKQDLADRLDNLAGL